MKRSATALLFLLLLASPPVAAEGRYVDSQRGFSMEIPPGWTGMTPKAGQPSSSCLNIWSNDGKCVFQVLPVDAGGATPETIEAQLTREAQAKGHRVLGHWPGRVAGQPSRSLAYESAKGIERSTIVALGPRTWILQYAAPTRAAWQASAPTFQAMLDSFRPEAVKRPPVSDSQARARAEEERRERTRYIERRERLRREQERLKRQREGY